jgi:hypothetical protein
LDYDKLIAVGINVIAMIFRQKIRDSGQVNRFLRHGIVDWMVIN